MGVTDLTPTLPWGGSSNGQPQLPPGYGGSSSWLNYLASMFGPSSAQASTLHPDLNNSQAALHPPMNNFSNPPPANGPGPGNVGPVPLNSGAADSVTMAPPGQGALPQARGVANPPFPGQGSGAGPSWFPGGSNTPMPWNGPTATPPPRPVNPNAPGAAAQTVSSPAAPGVLSGGATSANRGAPMGGGPAASNFSAMPYGTAQRGPGSAPMITAANLGNMNLFGGGQPAGQGAPQGAPSQTPPVPGPMAAQRGGNWAGTPDFSQLDDTTFDNSQPGQTGGSNPIGQGGTGALANAVKNPNWLKSLTGGATTPSGLPTNQFNPSQVRGLTPAIHRPQWWNTLQGSR